LGDRDLSWQSGLKIKGRRNTRKEGVVGELNPQNMNLNSSKYCITMELCTFKGESKAFEETG
jgi:hypothetical protein